MAFTKNATQLAGFRTQRSFTQLLSRTRLQPRPWNKCFPIPCASMNATPPYNRAVKRVQRTTAETPCLFCEHSFSLNRTFIQFLTLSRSQHHTYQRHLAKAQQPKHSSFWWPGFRNRKSQQGVDSTNQMIAKMPAQCVFWRCNSVPWQADTTTARNAKLGRRFKSVAFIWSVRVSLTT